MTIIRAKVKTQKDRQTEYNEEIQQPYFQSIKELLDKYEDGWDVFIKAQKEGDFRIPIPRKPEFANDPYLPDTWLELADKVISIIAHEKLKLNTGPNRIEIVRADQMLDAYVKPVPNGPHHWSYGKRRMIEQKNFDQSKHLAYEIIINSNPALAYCMDTNSPLMQLLVIAHASYGHNAFYKNNYLFKDSSDPDSILEKSKAFQNFCDECESKYGIDEVEQVLDFCYSMRFMDTTDQPYREKLTPAEIRKKKAEAKERAYLDVPPQRIFNNNANDNNRKTDRSKYIHPGKGERNILRFIADNAAHIPEWKREIMRRQSDISQHFRPNMFENVSNEGTACMTHYSVIDTMFTLGLIDGDMFTEFEVSHAGVTYQPPGFIYQKNKWSGEYEEEFIGSNINIYALGYAIYEDVKRICEDPTEEDIEWFPHFAGKGDWLNMFRHLMETTNNETLVQQYLSPNVMRRFKYFMLEVNPEMNDPNNSHTWLEVSAVTSKEGFKKLRDQLAADYRVSDQIPQISLKDFQEETDQCLVLKHRVIDNQPLEPKSLQMILEMIHAQTKHPVVIESINEHGRVLATRSSPPDYDYQMNKRSEPYYGYEM